MEGVLAPSIDVLGLRDLNEALTGVEKAGTAPSSIPNSLSLEMSAADSTTVVLRSLRRSSSCS